MPHLRVMIFSVLYLSVLFNGICTQDAAESTAPPGVVCSTCACADGRVHCAARDIRAPFSVDDWAAIATLPPTEVDLSGNHMRTFSELPSLPIQSLTASNCGIEVIDHGSFKHLTESLVTLDLSRNKLSTSSLDLRVFMGPITNTQPVRFAKMRHLSLAHNDIHSLPKDIFVFMQDITMLDLGGNPMAYMDSVTQAAISDLAKLQNLTLSFCDLEIIPEGLFRRLRRLQHLDLSGNRFTNVPTKIGEASNLIYLNLDKNPIESISENTPFATLTKLKELTIRRLSKLKSVGAGAMGGLQALSSLHLSHNPRLTTIDPRFLAWEDDDEVERWPQLQELYLNNNNLTHISCYFLDRWDLLRAADFSNNPYWCSCQSQWMVDVLVPLVRRLPGDSDGLAHMMHLKMCPVVCSCKGPEQVRGMTYAQLQNSTRTLVCMERMEAPQTDSAIMFGMMIGVLVTFPMVILVVLLWKRGIFSRCRRKTRSREYEEDMF